MQNPRVSRVLALCLAVAVSIAPAGLLLAQTPATAPLRQPDVIYVPTPPEVVDAMLEVAQVKGTDII
jgi:hypothetical protein